MADSLIMLQDGEQDKENGITFGGSRLESGSGSRGSPGACGLHGRNELPKQKLRERQASVNLVVQQRSGEETEALGIGQCRARFLKDWNGRVSGKGKSLKRLAQRSSSHPGRYKRLINKISGVRRCWWRQS